MFKPIILSIFFILFGLVSGQNNSIVFEKIINTADGNDIIIENKLLIFDDSESLFFDYDGDVNKVDFFLKSDNKIRSSQVIKGIFQNEKFEIKDNSFSSENIFAIDLFQDFNWKINKTETKSILNYKCFKATGNFRGRKYIAWYAPEISINVGPWKFRGLPGAILNITDEDGLYSFQAIKLSLNSSIEQLNYSKFSFTFPMSEESFVEYKKYISIEDQYISDIRSKIDSNRPKGTVVLTRSGNRDYQIEKSFEWETAK